MMVTNSVSTKSIISGPSCTYSGTGMNGTPCVVSPRNQQNYKTSTSNTMFTAARLTAIIPEENEEQMESDQWISLSSPKGQSSSFDGHKIFKEIEKLGLTAQIKRDNISDLQETNRRTGQIGNSFPKSEIRTMHSDVVNDEEIKNVPMPSMNYQRNCLCAFDENLLFENEKSYLGRRPSFDQILHSLSYSKPKAEGFGNDTNNDPKQEPSTGNKTKILSRNRSMIPYVGKTMSRSSSASDILKQKSRKDDTNTINIEKEEDMSLPDLWNVSSIPRTNSASNLSLQVAQKAYTNLAKETRLGTVLKDTVYFQRSDYETEHIENSVAWNEISNKCDKKLLQAVPPSTGYSDEIIDNTGTGVLHIEISYSDRKSELRNNNSVSLGHRTVEWATSRKVKQSKREGQMLIPIF